MPAMPKRMNVHIMREVQSHWSYLPHLTHANYSCCERCTVLVDTIRYTITPGPSPMHVPDAVW